MLVKDFTPSTHIRPHELVCGAIEVPDFEQTLPEAKMKERVSDRTGTTHGVRQIVAARVVVCAEEVCIADGDENPCRRFPIGLWLRKQIPRFPIVGKRIGKGTSFSVPISNCAETLDLVMHRIR